MKTFDVQLEVGSTGPKTVRVEAENKGAAMVAALLRLLSDGGAK